MTKTPTDYRRGTTKAPTSHTVPLISYGTIDYLILQKITEGEKNHNLISVTEIAKSIINKNCNVLDRSDCYKRLKNLVTKGYLKKSGYGLPFELTTQGRHQLGIISDVAMYDEGTKPTENTKDWWNITRAHNLKIKVNIITHPTKITSEWSKNDKLKNNVQYYHKFGDIHTTMTTQSFIFQLPILYFKDAELALAEAGRVVGQLIKIYEKLNPGLKLGEYSIKNQVLEKKSKLITQHHAIPQDPYAKLCHQLNISYRSEILDVDASDTPEIEFVDKHQAHAHHQRYAHTIEDIVTHPKVPLPSEQDTRIKTNTENISDLIGLHKDLALQMTNLTKLMSLKCSLENTNTYIPAIKNNVKKIDPWYIG